MDNPAGELRFHLARFGHRLRLRDGWLLAQRWLWVVCLLAALVQAAGRVRPLEHLWLWTLIPLAAWPLVVIGTSLFRPLPPTRIARRVDAELDLKERLATALALERWVTGTGLAGWPSLIARQHQDALATAQEMELRRAFPLRWLPQPLLLAGILAAGIVALAALPNPMHAVLAERAAVGQAAEEQANRIQELRDEIQDAEGLSPETRQELLRRLAELEEQLRANPGDREEALADVSQVEESLRPKLDANAEGRQTTLETLTAQLQALTKGQSDEETSLSDAAEALENLAGKLAEMDVAEKENLAQALARLAAQAAQAGDSDLAQALATLAQAAQKGETEAAVQAAQAAADALAQAQNELSEQSALRRTLSQLQASRRAIAEAGQGQAVADEKGQSTGQGQGQGPSQGLGQGLGQLGGGGGTQADTLPPASSVGQADRPQGEGQPGTVTDLEGQIFVPWEHRQGSGDELSITGQDTGQGETQIGEQQNPLPGATGQALVPYHAVYHDYLDAANQSIERSAIPPGLKDYVRAYFSQLEP